MSIKQLRSLYRQANIIFTNAVIYISTINFSLHLPEAQQTNLREINDHIMEHMCHIPPLDHHSFQTHPDDVHWTIETAQKMFTHWCLYLDLLSL